MNIIRILGLLFFVMSYFVVIIVVTIKKKKESQQSILLRILTNYLQLLTSALSFNLKFPDALNDLFFAAEKIGASSEAFMSFDCFIRDAELTGFAPSVSIFKIFLTGVLPLFLIILSTLIWLLFYFVISRKMDLKRNIIISIIVLIFMVHPMVTGVGFEIFQCVQVDEGDFRVYVDLNIGCFSSLHLKWCFIVGFPIIVIWTIICPLLVFIFLVRNRKRLDHPKVQSYFLILYQGLVPKAYYWEFVNTIRKIFMVAINVFMSTLPITYAALTAVFVLIAIIRIQINLQPYKSTLNNELEIEASIAGTATLF